MLGCSKQATGSFLAAAFLRATVALVIEGGGVGHTGHEYDKSSVNVPLLWDSHLPFKRNSDKRGVDDVISTPSQDPQCVGGKPCGSGNHAGGTPHTEYSSHAAFAASPPCHAVGVLTPSLKVVIVAEFETR